jgi:hypothetical protein
VKKQLVLTAVVLAVAFAGSALAGDYHTGDTLVCSECHVMHASQSHGYATDGSGNFISPVGEHEGLLRNEVNALCLSCHDGNTWAPDVLEAQTAGGIGVRSAGALNTTASSGDYSPANGHTLYSEDLAPGGTFQADAGVGLTCVDCHQQHGYGGHGGPANPWRNLYAGGGAFAYETETAPTGTVPVTQLAALDYTPANLAFTKVTSSESVSAYADYCKMCHTDFHGAVGGTEIGGLTASGGFVRHPAAEVIVGGIGGGHSSMTVWNGHTNDVPVQASLDGTQITPSCFSCHKGHGNQNAFGLIFMSGTGTVTEEGDDGTTAKDLCSQCHVQG